MSTEATLAVVIPNDSSPSYVVVLAEVEGKEINGTAIPLVPVVSQKLKAIGYDAEHERLVAQFQYGKESVYEYFEVDEMMYEGLVEAESKGSYFGKNIAGDRNFRPYKYRAVGFLGDTPEAVAVGFAPAPAPRKTTGKSLPPFEPETVKAPAGEIETLPEEQKQLVVQAAEIEARAKTVVITSAAKNTEAQEFLKEVVAQRKVKQAEVDAIKKPVYAAYQAALALEKKVIGPYNEAEAMLKDGIKKFAQKAEDERRKREAEAFKERQRVAKEEADRRAAEQAEVDARMAEAMGDVQEAQTIRANPLPVAPEPVAPVVLQSEFKTEKGISMREKWEYRINNAEEIPVTFAPQLAYLLHQNGLQVTPEKAAAIARGIGPIFNELYSLDEKKLGQKARTGKNTIKIEGVEIYDAGTISSR